MSGLLWRLSSRSARHASLLLCHAWPIVQSIRALQSNSTAQQSKWATFWMVQSPLWIVESLPWFAGLQRLPGYWHARVLALLWMTAERTEGARWIWEVAFRPWLVRHESSIDQRLDQLSAQSAEWAAVGKAKGAETLRKAIVIACMQLSAIVSRSLQASKKARSRLTGTFTESATSLTLLPVTPAASPIALAAAAASAAASSFAAVAPISLADPLTAAPLTAAPAVRTSVDETVPVTPASFLLSSLRSTVDEQVSQVVQEQLPALQAAAGEFVQQQLAVSLQCSQPADEQDENEAINYKRYCSPSPPPLRKSRTAASATAAAAGEPATLPPPFSAAKSSPVSSPPRQKLSHVNPRKNKTLQPLFDEMD